MADTDRRAVTADSFCERVARCQDLAGRWRPGRLRHRTIRPHVRCRQLPHFFDRSEPLRLEDVADRDAAPRHVFLKPTRNWIGGREKRQQDAGKADLRIVTTPLTNPGAEIVESYQVVVWRHSGGVMASSLRIAEDHRVCPLSISARRIVRKSAA
jgi:hypothetical protein